jgi:hypothetical protein
MGWEGSLLNVTLAPTLDIAGWIDSGIYTNWRLFDERLQKANHEQFDSLGEFIAAIAILEVLS